MVMLVTGILMRTVSSIVPSLSFSPPGRPVVASGLAFVGLLVAVAGTVSFGRARTSADPTNPAAASSLVVGGVYRFTRNPMYLGLFLGLLGWAAFLANALALVVALSFVPYMDRLQIEPEERALSDLFGAEYAAYKSRVRRWL
jgi:protein-S-isoprenylcysteine O-methyltransferase Ste14